jgi:hypothetical protein
VVSTNGNITTVKFYAGYGLEGQHFLEEYRLYTVLAGLGQTGLLQFLKHGEAVTD